MQCVDVGPGRPAARVRSIAGCVAGAPGIGQGRPVDLQAGGGGQHLPFADDRRAPVDDRAEDVEHQRLDLARIEVCCAHARARPIRIFCTSLRAFVDLAHPHVSVDALDREVAHVAVTAETWIAAQHTFSAISLAKSLAIAASFRQGTPASFRLARAGSSGAPLRSAWPFRRGGTARPGARRSACRRPCVPSNT